MTHSMTPICCYINACRNLCSVFFFYPWTASYFIIIWQWQWCDHSQCWGLGKRKSKCVANFTGWFFLLWLDVNFFVSWDSISPHCKRFLMFILKWTCLNSPLLYQICRVHLIIKVNFLTLQSLDFYCYLLWGNYESCSGQNDAEWTS